MSPEAISDFRDHFREVTAHGCFACRMAEKSLRAIAVKIPELQAVIDEEESPNPTGSVE